MDYDNVQVIYVAEFDTKLRVKEKLQILKSLQYFIKSLTLGQIYRSNREVMA